MNQMRWSPAPRPTQPTHQPQLCTTWPCPPLARCTPAFSLPAVTCIKREAWGDTVDRVMRGPVHRTSTALLCSGRSCWRRRASWGSSQTPPCWLQTETAEREFLSHMSLNMCEHRPRHSNNSWHMFDIQINCYWTFIFEQNLFFFFWWNLN